MSTEIHSGGLVSKDPDAIEFFVVDWDQEHLPTGVSIDTSTWAITGPDADLTDDEDSILSGGRKAQVRLSGGTPGAKYTVTNRITTDTTPPETKDASFSVLIEEA